MNFVFWFYLVGLVIASFQDLKRREVDNWLNLLLIVGGFGYLIFEAIYGNFNLLYFGILSFFCVFILANLFYYSRIFAGGDAKLLVAMFALFAAPSLFEMIINVVSFAFLLLLAGGLWGLCFGGVLFFKNWKKVRKEFLGMLISRYSIILFGLGVIFLIMGIWKIIILFLGIFVLVSYFLWIFAKSIEKKIMIKNIRGKDLREGDWLVDDVKIGKKLIESSFEGLSKSDVALLRKKKFVKIKEGLPFVPGFLIAFLIWVFYQQEILNFMGFLV